MKKDISDMNLVATLLALEVPYTEVKRKAGGSRLEFSFEGTASDVIVLENGDPVIRDEFTLTEIESYHASGNLLVSTDRLCSALKNVKSIIHGKR